MKQQAVWGLAFAVLAVSAAWPSSVQAQTVVVSGSGSGGSENPPVANGAHAYAQCTLDRSAKTFDCTARIYNLVDVSASHIHVGAPGANGPVIINSVVPLHVSGDVGISWTATESDLIRRAAEGINTIDDAIEACAAGNCYFNVHTTQSPGGAVRVQLCPANRAANTINGIALCTAPQ
jgi:hypothetical protein